MSLKNGPATEFLNVDLDLRAEAGLEDLLGYQPHQSSFGLSQEMVASLADIQAEAFTLYAPRGR